MKTELAYDDIQGNILQGYKHPRVGHFFISLRDDDSVPRCRKFIQQLLEQQRITTAAPDGSATVCINMGISGEGLRRLAPGSAAQAEARFPSFAAGMNARSPVLGDERARDQELWDQRDVWLSIHAETDSEIDAVASELAHWPDAPKLAGPLRGYAKLVNGHRVEHFGFRDDVSGAVIEGRPGDKSCIGTGKYDRQRDEWVPLATGEFLLGHDNEQGLNPLEGLSQDSETLFRNGTFAVFRDLEQHVAAFHRYVNEKATKDPDVAARMIGRRVTGEPLERPGAASMNDFIYDGDEKGARCPIGAHIRRANPRRDGEHRIVRRGMLYGDFSEDGGPEEVQRGIYFVALNASIEAQFEFLQRTWVNGPPSDGSNGADPIAASSAGTRQMVIQGDQYAGRSPVLLLDIPRFVTLRGGQYYFMPGIAGLKQLCGMGPRSIGASRSPARSEPRPPPSLFASITTSVKEILDGLSDVLPAARWRWAKVGDGGLYLREFTALLGVLGDVSALRKLLEAENADDERYALPGIHALRWVLFQPTGDTEQPAPESDPWALALSMVIDAEEDDVLEVLSEKADLARLLRYCDGFQAAPSVASFLKSRRVKSGFLFRDLGPLRKKMHAREFVVDATRREIEGAVALQRKFEEFYDEYPLREGATAIEMARFAERFFGTFGDIAPLSLNEKFERAQPDESRWARRLSELSLEAQKRVARLRPDKVPHRGAHAKGHALLEGTLTVVKTDAFGCQTGLFATPGKTFPVRVRLSSGSPAIQSDGERDARGMAIRVTVADQDASKFLNVTGETPDKQDFILFSNPVFFASDVRQFTTIFGILSTRSKPEQVGRLLGFLLKARSVKPLWFMASTLFRSPINHPLAIEYHSASPYMLGEHLVAKYSVEALDREAFRRAPRGAGDDFLTRAVEGDEKTPLKLAFYVHVLSTREMPGEGIKDIVEDATVDFRKLGARKVKVAELELRHADPKDRSDRDAAEGMDFNPWNSLAAHRPLGSLNRARLIAYRDSLDFRQGNETARPAPAAAGPSASQQNAAE